MMLNPLDLILTLLARLLGMAVPQYRPPSQPPLASENVIQLPRDSQRGHDRRGQMAATKR